MSLSVASASVDVPPASNLKPNKTVKSVETEGFYARDEDCAGDVGEVFGDGAA